MDDSSALLRQLNLTLYARIGSVASGKELALVLFDPAGSVIQATKTSPSFDTACAAIKTQLPDVHNGLLRVSMSAGGHLIALPLDDLSEVVVGWVGAIFADALDGRADALAEEIRQALQLEYRAAFDRQASTLELTQRYEELNFVYRLTSTIQDFKSHTAVYQALTRICLDHLTLEAAILVLSSRDGGEYAAVDPASKLDMAVLSKFLIRDILPDVTSSRASVVVNTSSERARYTTLAGADIKLIASPVFKGGQVVGVLGVAGVHPLPDFSSSDRKLVETMAHHVSSVVNIHAMSENARRLSKVIEQTPDLVMVTDKAGVIEYVNPAFEQITGYGRHEAIGSRPSILKSGEHGDELYKQLWDAITRGQEFRHVFVNRKKNGDKFYAEQSIVPLKDDTGEVASFVSTAKDITDQIRSQEEAKTALREKLEAEAINKAKSQFFSSMTHELRTPLNAIIGFGDLLTEEIQSAGHNQYLKDLQVMIKAGHHLLSLINNVLDMSKIEAGKIEVFSEPFSIRGLVEEVAQTVEPLARKNGNQLLVQCASDLEKMRSDKTKIKQILFNLISNAAKFTKQGSITLTVQRAEDNASNVVFRVVDTGIGMTREQLARMFQAFSQADASIARDYGGTGLGLMISKRFAEMLSGKIDVDSEPGKGTTFTVTLARYLESEKTESF